MLANAGSTVLVNRPTVQAMNPIFRGSKPCRRTLESAVDTIQFGPLGVIWRRCMPCLLLIPKWHHVTWAGRWGKGSLPLETCFGQLHNKTERLQTMNLSTIYLHNLFACSYSIWRISYGSGSGTIRRLSVRLRAGRRGGNCEPLEKHMHTNVCDGVRCLLPLHSCSLQTLGMYLHA